MSDETYSLCQFFEDGSYEYVHRFVSPEEIKKALVHYCTSVRAKLGFVVRVIVIDGGDNIVFEWKYGEGVTWPPEEEKEETKH